MTDMLEGPDVRRSRVPSMREVEAGIEDYAFNPLPVVVEEKIPLGTRVRAMAKQLDPRDVAAEGPILPLVLMFLAAMCIALDDGAFGTLLPDIRDTFHFDVSFLLGLGTILQIVNLMAAPAMGFLADRIKRVRMLATGGVVIGVGSALSGAAPGIGAAVAARTAIGFGRSASEPTTIPLIADYFPPAVRARPIAFVALGTSVGFLVGPTLGGALGSLFGWRTAMISIGTLATVVAFSFFALKEPRRGEQDRLAMGADQETAAKEQAPVGWAEGWRAAASIQSLRRIWYAAPFVTAGGSILLLLVGLYFADAFGLSSFERGLINSSIEFFGLIGLLISGPVADRLLAYKPGRVFTLFGAVLLLNCALTLGLILSPVLWLSVLFSLPLGFGIAMTAPALFTLVSLVVPARVRSFGVQTIAPWQLLGFVMVLVINALGRATSTRAAMIPLIGIFAIGAVLIGSAGSGVERDMRAARAASMADEEARRSRAEGATKMIICRDVDVTYDGTRVLFNVDFDIAAGEIVAVLGTNGAGKSTLLRAISGIQEASNGAIFLDGVDITHRPSYLNAADGVVFMPGGHAVFPTLTVKENLQAAAWLYRKDDAYVKAETAKVLDMFPVLEERLDARAGTMSGGEQQMLALSQAFLMKPRLLMIDELSLGLAPAIIDRLLDVVRQVNESGTTVVLVEQSVNVALTVAERAVFLDKGRVQFDGPTRELLGRSDLVRSVFLGGVGAGAAPKASGGGIALRRRREETEVRVALEAHDLDISFGGRQVLDHASLTVDTGEVLGIIGPNGAGKTTLFDVLSGYATPSGGTVKIAEQDASGLSPDARARLGLSRSFQNARMFPALTVRENVAVALEQHIAARSAVMAAAWLPPIRRSEKRVARRVEALIGLFQLEAYGDKFVGELSTGTRRMVDMACIMAAEPHVLLLDEPSSGLAQAEVEVLSPTIRRLARETHCGVLVIEHDLPLVTSVSDRMLAMELGRVIAEGPPDDVVSHPDVVSAYLGASQSTIQRSGAALSDALAQAGLLSNKEGPNGHGS